ncbi:hypothetical protein GCM10010969_17800 [Saccharibacillus kuerlensis]|uniref:UvrD-like helicase ATP-binding domain-containing protein n=1 Tax=Saccharibacillus kuerlensis TaxID=459527 RepID=A0ABQ2L0Q4_9BACL|nr:hypothetical protein GCM10010969_17800 [Saccharibacillus kuerlensis]
MVSASAGTGKTHTMVNKIVNEIEVNKDHKVIAAVTFTIKAAQEIKERIKVDVSRHFIGTNNSFVIEEIVQPFIKDVYGPTYDIILSADYSTNFSSFEEGLEVVAQKATLGAYSDDKKNFIFELAQDIVKRSKACQLYLQAKYFKIYIDEYQDCDKSMHELFMFLAEKLDIETFIVGDDKQSIYIWRGAYPEAFKSIWRKDNFSKISLSDNFRSCQQIQNYSNLLCEETRVNYVETKQLENIIWVNSTYNTWYQDVLQFIDNSKTTALLRFSNDNSKKGAEELSSVGFECIHIPKIPLADITTESAWIYNSIAKNYVLNHYSVYDFISEIPNEGENSKRKVKIISDFLQRIKDSLYDSDGFFENISGLGEYLNYSIEMRHVRKLQETLKNESFHVAFESERYQNTSITFHSSKGLEFDQVIVFAEDYRLHDMSSIYNHYVAVTRAKNKLIIIKCDHWAASKFEANLRGIFAAYGKSLEDMVYISS